MRNNETYGISLEVAIADAFNVPVSPEYRQRADEAIVENAIPYVYDAIISNELPFPEQHVAERQNPVDFILADGLTLSAKSNFDNLGKASPRDIGQPSDSTWYEYLGHYIVDDDDYNSYPYMDYEQRAEVFKRTVLANPAGLLAEYFPHIFGCDYLIYGYNMRDNDAANMNILLLGKYGYVPVWDNCDFSFTRDISDWNESTTVSYPSLKRMGFRL